MVSHSTPQSREAKEVSKLAIFETIFFTVLVLAVTIYTDTTTYLLSSILIAPFLLLKTPRSVELSHKMFFYPIINNHDDMFNFMQSYKFYLIIMIFLSISCSYLINFYDDKNCACFQIGMLNSLILQIFLVALLFHTIEFKDKGMIGLTLIIQIIILILLLIFIGFYYGWLQSLYFYLGYTPFTFLFLPLSITSGLFIRSLAIKFIVTAYVVIIELFTNPIKLLENIAQNYREQLLVNNSFYTPELLPEISKVSHKYSLLAFYQKFL